MLDEEELPAGLAVHFVRRGRFLYRKPRLFLKEELTFGQIIKWISTIGIEQSSFETLLEVEPLDLYDMAYLNVIEEYDAAKLWIVYQHPELLLGQFYKRRHLLSDEDCSKIIDYIKDHLKIEMIEENEH